MKFGVVVFIINPYNIIKSRREKRQQQYWLKLSRALSQTSRLLLLTLFILDAFTYYFIHTRTHLLNAAVATTTAAAA